MPIVLKSGVESEQNIVLLCQVSGVIASFLGILAEEVDIDFGNAFDITHEIV